MQEDGRWGWQEDGSLDFDVSELPDEERELIEAVLELEGSGLTADGRVRHQDMNDEVVGIITGGVLPSPQTVPGTFLMGPETSKHALDSAQFRYGTMAFAEVSGIAAGMMSGGFTEDYIEAFNTALLVAQGSGLLIENAVEIGSYDRDSPFIYPGENNHTVLTSDVGYRFRFNANGQPTNYLHEGGDYAVYDSQWRPYENGEVGVRSRQESEVRLAWGGSFGNQVISTGATLIGQYSHMHANTVMDYLAAFGSEGVTATLTGLSGVPAGMRIGSVGNTGGESTGTHLDFITERVDPVTGRITTVSPADAYPALDGIHETEWSQIHAGHESNRMTGQTAFEIYQYYQNDARSVLPYMNFMERDQMRAGARLIIQDMLEAYGW